MLETPLGAIGLELRADRAPRVCAWFLALVESGAFTGRRFYRSGSLPQADGALPPPQLIEGGMLDRFALGEAGPIVGSPEAMGLPVLKDWETTGASGLRHQRGTLSMARDLTGSGDAIPDLVICTRDLPQLDEGGGHSPGNLGFPAFGRVMDGMDVVDRIASLPRTGHTPVSMLAGQIVDRPVEILHASRRTAG